MTHITADDLEIDTSEHDADPYEALAQSFDNAVARIAELEAQLAAARESKMHETERAQTLIQERNAIHQEYDALFNSIRTCAMCYKSWISNDARCPFCELDAAREDARELFAAIDAYLTEKKRLTYSAGYALAEGTPDPHVLALAKLAAVRIEHGEKYLKDGEK